VGVVCELVSELAGSRNIQVIIKKTVQLHTVIVNQSDHSSSAPELTAASLIVVVTDRPKATHARSAPRLHYRAINAYGKL